MIRKKMYTAASTQEHSMMLSAGRKFMDAKIAGPNIA
jgi:hypothetical protein